LFRLRLVADQTLQIAIETRRGARNRRLVAAPPRRIRQEYTDLARLAPVPRELQQCRSGPGILQRKPEGVARLVAVVGDAVGRTSGVEKEDAQFKPGRQQFHKRRAELAAKHRHDIGVAGVLAQIIDGDCRPIPR
jgi:hypothetical protein